MRLETALEHASRLAADLDARVTAAAALVARLEDLVRTWGSPEGRSPVAAAPAPCDADPDDLELAERLEGRYPELAAGR